MLRKHRKLLYYADIIADAVVIVLSYIISMYTRYYIMDSDPGLPVLTAPYLLVVAVYGVVMAFIFSCAQPGGQGWNADKTGLYEKSTEGGFYRLLSINVVGCLVLMSFFYLVGIMYFSRWALVLFWGVSTILIMVKKTAVLSWASRERVKEQCGVNSLVIGDGRLAEEYISSAYSFPSLGRNIVGYVRVHKDAALEERFSTFTWDSEEKSQKSHELVCLGGISDIRSLLESLDIDEVVLALEDVEAYIADKVSNALEGANIRIGMVTPYSGLIPSEAVVYGFGDTKVIETRKKDTGKGTKAYQMGILLSVSVLLIMLILNRFSFSFGLGDFPQLDAYETYKCIVFAVLGVFVFSYLTSAFKGSAWANTKRAVISFVVCIVFAAVYEPVYTGGAGYIDCIIMDLKAVAVSAALCWCVSGLIRRISRELPMMI
ncbi:MAG: hypothetical protein LUE16_11745 [Lachnospiraceae bacterium]|nr:hypothetical protein [Lachnospiraceae bacterium]